AVDEQRRRGPYAEAPSLPRLRTYGRQVAVAVDAGVEGRLVQSEVGAEALQVVLAERAAVLARLLGEQLVVVGPELPLVAGALRRRGRLLGLVAEEGQVVVDQLDLPTRQVGAFQLALDAEGELPAGRTLEVCPLVDHDRGVGVALDLAARRGGHGRGRRAGLAEQDERAGRHHGQAHHREQRPERAV